MRDRRNTNLSTSSASSSSSSTTSGDSPTEKEKLATFDELPAPVTKENAGRRRRPHRVALKVFGIVFCVLLLLRCVPPALPIIGLLPSSIVPANRQLDSGRYTGEALPDEPKVMMVTDAVGRSRWTVSIPPSHPFPLRPHQYQDICSQGESLRETITASSTIQRAKSVTKWRGYYAKDPTFIDVPNAQRQGLLPPSPPVSETIPTCERSLTFSLETPSASFGKSLLLLWLSYGLAKKEGRAFFINDAHWPYGNYSTFFQPPPTPSCAPPPPSQILPCPHTAAHLLVSAATADQTFGAAFKTKFQNPRKQGSARNKGIYDLVRTGYEALFHLNSEDAAYAATRIAALQTSATEHQTPILGLHIRRGDLHPHEVQFSADYLPLDRYTSAAAALLHTLTTNPDSAHGAKVPLLLASDDPTLYTSPDLSLALAATNTPFALEPAQSRIQLATKAALDASSPRPPIREPGSAYVKHVDENSGWEGGFYPALLFSAGSQGKREGEGVGEGAMRMRELVARAYVLDLAVLGQGAQGVVCGVSAAGCRVLGVMVGWEGVREGGAWRNVDLGAKGWSWDGSR